MSFLLNTSNSHFINTQVSERGILSTAFTDGLQGVLPSKISAANLVSGKLFCEHELIAMQHISAIDKKRLTDFIKTICIKYQSLNNNKAKNYT